MRKKVPEKRLLPVFVVAVAVVVLLVVFVATVAVGVAFVFVVVVVVCVRTILWSSQLSPAPVAPAATSFET